MAVKIKGIHMPNCCTECPFYHIGFCFVNGSSENISEIFRDYERDENCPLEEVPDEK